MATHSSILAWAIKFHVQMSLVATIHGVAESDRTEGLTLSLSVNSWDSVIMREIHLT